MAQIWMRRITQSASLSDTATVMCEGANVMKESCFTYEWVMVHPYEWAMAHIWMSYGTNMNESWHKYEWVMAQIWMSHGTNMNESWHKYEWLMVCIRMSRITQNLLLREKATLMCEGANVMKESSYTYEWVMVHTYEWVMAQIWMSHGTNMNESWHKYE